MPWIPLQCLGILLFCQKSLQSGSVSVSRCCGLGSRLDQNKECQPYPSRGEPAFNNILKQLPDNVLKSDPKLPDCETDEYEVFYWNSDGINFSSTGQLITTKYSARYPINSYCLDTIEDDVVAIACNPCASGTCIPLCCPHGHKFQLTSQEYEGYQPYRCQPNTFTSCVADDQQLNFYPDWVYPEMNKEILVDMDFKCSRGVQIYGPSLFGETDYSLHSNASLNVSIDVEQLHHFGDYCLGNNISNPEQLSLDFYVCHEPEDPSSERVNTAFYTASLYISAFFFLLTFIIYLYITEFRNALYHQITMCYLLNAMIAYLCLGSTWIVEKDIKGNPGCVALGYISQHTLIGLFTWITAMTMKITKLAVRQFQMVNHQQNNPQMGTFAKYFAVFQGIPMVVSVVTALLDAYGDCSWILPNMGRFACVPRSSQLDNRGIEEDGLFLYLHLIILIFIIINLIGFLVTIFLFISHWTTTNNVFRQPDNRESSSTSKNIKNAFLVFKLFILMGLPWSLEIASIFYVFKKEQGSTEINGVTIALDVINLFTGLIVFVVLVCKKDVLQKLRKKRVINTVQSAVITAMTSNRTSFSSELGESVF